MFRTLKVTNADGPLYNNVFFGGLCMNLEDAIKPKPTRDVFEHAFCNPWMVCSSGYPCETLMLGFGWMPRYRICDRTWVPVHDWHAPEQVLEGFKAAMQAQLPGCETCCFIGCHRTAAVMTELHTVQLYVVV